MCVCVCVMFTDLYLSIYLSSYLSISADPCTCCDRMEEEEEG